MKKIVTLSLVVSALLVASDSVELNKLEVVDTPTSTIVKNIAQEEIQSADLGEALSKVVPSVTIIRRSGIANDILVRGQKRDNINVLIDGAKVCGACPNRMDPPISHVLTNNVENVEVQEGPYDVENFGALAATVKVTTIKPTKETSGDVNLNVGSWDYKKASATASGGNDKLRALISASIEQSGQYKDGNGDDFAQQVKNKAPVANQYKSADENMKAYEKKTFMGKVFYDVADNQELAFSYTANRSDNILYANSKMDALYDDSNIYNLEYSFKDLGSYSEKLELQAYHTDVRHPMSTEYRNASNGAMGAMVNDLKTDMDGLKVKNSFYVGSHKLMVGADASKRLWDGSIYKQSDVFMLKSINSVKTTNQALFTTMDKTFSNIEVKVGMRYDNAEVNTADVAAVDNNYNYLSANIFATMDMGSDLTYSAGVGKSSRVPDARELYNRKSTGALEGTPDLKHVDNYEVDLGVEKKFEGSSINAKVFYSMLNNYIAYNKSQTTNMFENVDARVYGLELNGYYFLSDDLFLEAGAAYQKGTRDALRNQSGTNLADMPPLKANVKVTSDMTEVDTASVEVLASNAWDNYDAENGEQHLAGWGILNLQYKRELGKGFDAMIGIDNVLNQNYARSNTYADLTLLGNGANTMLMNEPGRYMYANLRYSF
ncbi:MAG: TonB-dependent receptor plug domain-containing protein [Helicobacteraceae bacterium]|nr:TonB-dependent receptor plug domain-containing protein [Helicobacteraceae bacterium]